MKKKLLLVLTIFSTLCLVGCKEKVKEDIVYIEVSGNNWEALCRHTKYGKTTDYIYDKDTEIVYVCVSAGYGVAISAYYNKDGKPMKKDEFELIHLKEHDK